MALERCGRYRLRANCSQLRRHPLPRSDERETVTGPTTSVAQEKKRQGLFGRIFAPREQAPKEAAPPRSLPPRASGPSSRGSSSRNSSRREESTRQATGTRTICVRSCDGYYFPISSSASRKRFKIDEAVCKAMYGGASAELYFHDNQAPVDTAVSLKGKSLAAEPFAFAFRRTFSESCQAELKIGLARLGDVFIARSTEAVPERIAENEPIPSPRPRLVAGADPETLFNRAGEFEVARVTSNADVASAPIRKLGPDYYYAQPIAIEALRDPPSRPTFTLIGSAQANSDRGGSQVSSVEQKLRKLQ